MQPHDKPTTPFAPPHPSFPTPLHPALTSYLFLLYITLRLSSYYRNSSLSAISSSKSPSSTGHPLPSSCIPFWPTCERHASSALQWLLPPPASGLYCPDPCSTLLTPSTWCLALERSSRSNDGALLLAFACSMELAIQEREVWGGLVGLGWDREVLRGEGKGYTRGLGPFSGCGGRRGLWGGV